MNQTKQNIKCKKNNCFKNKQSKVFFLLLKQTKKHAHTREDLFAIIVRVLRDKINVSKCVC